MCPAVASYRPAVLLLVLTLLLVPAGTAGEGAEGPVEVAACTKAQGSLLVPTGNHNPPILTTRTMQTAAIVYWIEEGLVQKERNFTLVSLDPQFRTKVGSIEVFVPDFDIFWFDVNGNRLEPQIHSNPGDEKGKVPDNADHGIVFMSHGPGAFQPPSNFEYEVC